MLIQIAMFTPGKYNWRMLPNVVGVPIRNLLHANIENLPIGPLIESSITGLTATASISTMSSKDSRINYIGFNSPGQFESPGQGSLIYTAYSMLTPLREAGMILNLDGIENKRELGFLEEKLEFISDIAIPIEEILLNIDEVIALSDAYATRKAADKFMETRMEKHARKALRESSIQAFNQPRENFPKEIVEEIEAYYSELRSEVC